MPKFTVEFYSTPDVEIRDDDFELLTRELEKAFLDCTTYLIMSRDRKIRADLVDIDYDEDFCED